MAVQFDKPGSAAHDVTADPNSKYYIGPIHNEIRSGDDIRDDVTQNVDEEIANGWLKDVTDPSEKDKVIQTRYEEQLQKTRQGLDQDLQIRDPGAPPTTMWDNATHEQMQQTITDNADSAAVAVTSEEWVALGNELTEHQQNLADAINDSVSDWQGSGGDAAREHLASVGKWLGTTAQGSSLTGRQQEIHSQSLNETQKQMAANPPVQFSVQDANARLQTITDPVQYATQATADMAMVGQQKAAQQQAARIMTQYDETVGGAIATPEFQAPPKLASGSASTGGTAASNASGTSNAGLRTLGSSTTPASAGSAGSGGEFSKSGDFAAATALNGGAGGAGGSAGDLAGSGAGSGSGSGSGSGYSGSGIGGGSYGGSGSGSGSGSGYTGSGIGTSGGNGSGGNGSYTGSNIPTDGTSPSSVTGTTISSHGGPGSVTGNIPTIGYGGGVNGDSIANRLNGLNVPGSFPAGEGIGGIGSSGAGGSGIGGAGIKGIGGSGGAGSGSAGSRLSAGSVSGAGAAEEAAAGRGGTGGASSSTGRGTTGGMPHGGGKKGEGDKEHKIADYVEGEPDLFEGEQVIAPPVIGDWKKTKTDKKKK
ncbi:hypothetical protein FPZ12_006045 [Amycolatopsis acidicola]|uniref:PPE domain-containing protein n=1 Tax=Amycolatopsis acidicola TaxID=2596893 RepID=A0A5N0VJG7_9PSEU|nr:hypothetical protein [Amycolatopsis acidicola]KAA9165623.1 hypothetical protein FPZ12_006045 [Amycolatopsis acidicola]